MQFAVASKSEMSEKEYQRFRNNVRYLEKVLV